MCIRDRLTDAAALQAAGRIAILFQHGLSDVNAPRSRLCSQARRRGGGLPVSYTHLRAHETSAHL
eukprot:12884143-Alexandrium_andersonii.AAC.1